MMALLLELWARTSVVLQICDMVAEHPAAHLFVLQGWWPLLLLAEVVVVVEVGCIGQRAPWDWSRASTRGVVASAHQTLALSRLAYPTCSHSVDGAVGVVGAHDAPCCYGYVPADIAGPQPWGPDCMPTLAWYLPR